MDEVEPGLGYDQVKASTPSMGSEMAARILTHFERSFEHLMVLMTFHGPCT